MSSALRTVGDELGEALAELWAERRQLRAVVAVLLLGTLGLVVLMGFGEGTHVAMDGALQRSSDRMLRYSAGSTTRPFRGLPAGRHLPLTYELVQELADVPGVRAVSVEFQFQRELRGSAVANATVLGVQADYPAIRGMGVRPDGRFLSPIDLAERRRVVCLGELLARDLFGTDAVVGRQVHVAGMPFQVVGVVPERVMVMNYGGEDARKAYLPATTAMAAFGRRQPHYGLVQVQDPRAHAAVDGAVRARLGARLGFDPQDQPALRLTDHVRNAGQIRDLLTGTRAFLFVMGALGLLVAALGVGNAMFARVEAKRRELGLRRALGLTARGIVLRQLLETVLVVAAGGGAGFLLSVLLLAGLDALPFDARAKGYLGSPVPSAWTALQVIGLLALVTLVAGLQPARAAARVLPVEALRHD